MTLNYESGDHVDNLDHVAYTMGCVWADCYAFFRVALSSNLHRIVADLGKGIRGGDFVLSSHSVLLEMKSGMAWAWAARDYPHCTAQMVVPNGAAR